MSAIKSLALLTLVLTASLAFGQNATVQGKVHSKRNDAPIEGVTVRLTNINDTAETYVAPTDAKGFYWFPGLQFKTYVLSIIEVGYLTLVDTISVVRPVMDLGDRGMTQTVIPLDEVLVQERAIPVVQKNDTTEFNAAAFKTHPDADAGDLVEKMPGVTVQNGNVTAQGEQVQQVLVDGKPFFGNDASLALHNLPADAVDKIQVYDKKSDQAEFTGFDDGQSIKTINIITKPDKRNQTFGKLYGGAGDQDRYQGGGSVNSFHEDT
ncbi:MAG TPA: TonB-dependent receptor, partial [Bacteroidota bacterium]|nr:TonB-dependent receptor [Bacteroidota bacterium]